MGSIEDLRQLVSEGKVHPPDDDELETVAPFLWEMLTLDRWKDGKERLLPVVKVERVDGGYRVTLQDDSLCIKKSAMARRWAEIPQAIEKALVDPDVPWESFKSYRNRSGPPVPEEKNGRQRKRK